MAFITNTFIVGRLLKFGMVSSPSQDADSDLQLFVENLAEI